MNLKELSEVLGLSPTTVSRALNGYPEVNARTRVRVVEAAQRYGYVPNSMARRLATGRAMAIGHVVPLAEHDMINPIFADFIAGAGEYYSQAGYKMVLAVVSTAEEETTYTDLAAEQSVDGVIVHGPRAQDPRIPLLSRLGLPFLVHGRADEGNAYAWLDINNRRSFFNATKLLTDLGHRRISLLNGIADMHFAIRRRQGYEDALGVAEIDPDPRLIFHRDMTEPYGYKVARQLLDGPDAPTAFVSSSLITAMGIARAIADRGLVMGTDISVVTHDDDVAFLPNHGDRPLFTATKSSVRAAGRRGAEMLIDQIEGRADKSSTELWDTEIVMGMSTGPCPV